MLNTLEFNKYQSTEYLLEKKRTKNQQTYFSLYYQKHQEKLLTKRKSRYLNQKPLLWNNFFTCKKPWCSVCIQAGIKETEYKFCGENCSVKYWLSIYEKTYFKKERESKREKKQKREIEQFSSHTRNEYLTSPHAPDSSLHVRAKNFFWVGEAGAIRPLLLNTIQREQNKQERRKRRDQAWRRLATKDKVAQTAGFNLPTHREKRSVEELLRQHGEYSYLTGKPLGNYYLSTLDIDLRKVEFPEKMIAGLEKSIKKITNCLRTSYDKTKKGLHVDILTPEILPNEIIYYRGWGKLWNIGSIQSKGKYVVGEDKEKEFVKNGKWYWKVDRNEEIRDKLAKFFFRAGKQQQITKKPTNQSLNSKKINQIVQRVKQILKVKVLSVKKTRLTDFLRIFYFNKTSQKKGYFLLNAYQKPDILPSLSVGSVCSVLLVSGRKHDFFSRLRLNKFASLVSH